MKRALLIGGLAAAIACGSSAGDIMDEAFDDMTDVPDAGAQSTDCNCEAGPAGEQGPQGDPGPQGEPGPSGIVAAISFAPQTFSSSDVGEWKCEFGTEAGEWLDVATGQRLLITGQGIVEASRSPDFKFRVAWREVGDSSNGAPGHQLVFDDWGPAGMHATELTPPLDAGTYQFGICISPGPSASVVATNLYGTAMVINTATQ